MDIIPEVILRAYGLSSDAGISRLTDGLINQTYRVTQANRTIILQKLNQHVFPNAKAIMENIAVVHDALRKEPGYLVPEVLLTLSSEQFVEDDDQNAWRAIYYVPNTRTFNATQSPKVATEAGRLIGMFHRLTSSIKPDALTATLPNFHSIAHRARLFQHAITQVGPNRRSLAKAMIEFYERWTSAMRQLEYYTLPKRVTHNDTKLNNILFDKATDLAICLIDLDTLMPGHLHHDFGDALRTLCNAATEQEPDLTKVQFQWPIFEAFCQGYFPEVHELLTESEWEVLPHSLMQLPYLMGVRFLTDYLDGDRYYRTDYDTQNLDRAKNQAALINRIQARLPEIVELIHSYRP